jgi:hypothetical protein
MELMSNQVFRLLHDKASGEYPAGIYRVIFDEAAINKTICVYIQLAGPEKVTRGGRRKLEKTKNPRKKSPTPLIGELLWMERDYLERLQAHKLLITVEIEREPIYFIPIESPKDQEIFSQRRRAMASFLDFEKKGGAA